LIGRTADFDSANLGSSPSGEANSPEFPDYSLPSLAYTHLIAQHHILPRNLRQRDQRRICPDLCRRLTPNIETEHKGNMIDARSPHPALDEHLKTMSMRQAGAWEMSLHCKCGVCGSSAAQPIKLLLSNRPSLERHTVDTVCEKLRCGKCSAPYLVVWMSDDRRGPNCKGVYPRPWGVAVTDRRHRAAAKGLPNGDTDVPDGYAPEFRASLPNNPQKR
ncbi:hypothetical protein, partial [Acetobacter indonesiensis]|uniref:hypothetical protein n=1 Tax=Acetobacter indonesiensis TaxID=104101 RepID=UPI001C4E9324